MKKYNKKIEAILLGKVENLKWFYFELDFIKALEHPYIGSDSIEKFFEQINEKNYGELIYEGEQTEESKKEILRIILTIINKNPTVAVAIMRRIFDLNKIENKTRAFEGRMGKMNLKNRDERNDLYDEKIAKGHRRNKENVVILAEGDSWFQFPKLYAGNLVVTDPVKDIIDCLIEEDKYAVNSIAAGGDWLSNMFSEDEYIEQLGKVSPDVLLLSGGGNDMVGDGRLALMVINHLLEDSPVFKNDTEEVNDKRFEKLLELRAAKGDEIDFEKYKRGLRFLSIDFFYFVNVVNIQYYIFIHNLVSSKKYKKMMIITQGYDYLIPYEGFRGKNSEIKPFQRIYNHVLSSGRWLYHPLMMKGITEQKDQEAILYTMVYEFNEMMIGLANNARFKNLFHIDARGIAKKNQWFDELHLKDEVYEKIAAVFKKCIDENLRLRNEPKKKVYRVVDEIKYLNF